MDNPKKPEFRSKRKIYYDLFLILTLMLLFLPIWNSLQDILTRLVIYFHWYDFISTTIVPYELRVIGLILTVLQFPVKVGNTFIEFTRPDKSHEAIYLIWNCVGWQSAVFLVVTMISGLSGKHTFLSKAEALLLGMFGTYLVNILRLSLVIMIYYFFGRFLGTIFHDYISNLLTLFWLFFFWWFSFKFVLEEKNLPKE